MCKLCELQHFLFTHLAKIATLVRNLRLRYTLLQKEEVMKNPPTPLIDVATKNFFRQSYEPAKVIEGVQFKNVKAIPADEGDFAEVLRVGNDGSLDDFKGFHIRQINRTRLEPGSIKAWHFHFKQDEIWYIPAGQSIVVGLWDIRKDSPTAGVQMRVCLSGGHRSMVHIPRAVAHGSVNFSHDAVQLFYFVNQQFNLEDPDEFRLHWDAAGADFWTPERD